MMKRNACILGLLMGLSGCIGGTSPDPDYYALAPVPGAVMADVTYVVKIQRPFLAGYLDRPEIVRQDSDYSVQIDDSRRWAEPLDTMFGRILMQDMQQRLPNAKFLSEGDSVPVAPRVVVAVNIQQFNRVPHDQVLLQAQLDVHSEATHEQPSLQNIHDAINTDSSVAAENLSMLVGRLADRIAVLLHNQVVESDKAASKSGALPTE